MCDLLLSLACSGLDPKVSKIPAFRELTYGFVGRIDVQTERQMNVPGAEAGEAGNCKGRRTRSQEHGKVRVQPQGSMSDSRPLCSGLEAVKDPGQFCDYC